MVKIGKEFEDKLKEIFFYVARYGVVTELSLNEKLEDFNYDRFITLCNEGFKIGQNLVLQELIKLEAERKIIEEKIKQKRKEIRNNERKEMEKVLHVHKYKEELIKNLVYTIAWQQFNGKREILARFYTQEMGSNQLTGKGFEAILLAANDINKDPEKFALISDLTNNIQIGDLLVITPEGHEVIEVKTGEKNAAALRLMEFYKVNRIEITEARIAKNFDKNFADQILRMQKQNIKSDRLKKIVEEDKGEHPKFENTRVELIDSPIKDETFHEEIGGLLKQLKEKDWAYTNVWGVINIGAYKNDWRFRGMASLTEINKNFPVFDIVSLGVNVSEPIFAKPMYWGDENIIDIALGKIKVFVGINFDQFIKFSNDLGLPLRWSTRKELSRLYDSSGGLDNKEIFSHYNKGLVIQDHETKGDIQFVGMGMLFRMIYDHISPLTLIQNRAIGFNELKKMKASENNA